MWPFLFLLAADPPAESYADHAWALAYTQIVTFKCPGWERREGVTPPPMLPRAENWNTDWGEEGYLTKAYRAGGQAVEAAAAADPKFCDHPTRSQPQRAALLDRSLVKPAARPGP